MPELSADEFRAADRYAVGKDFEIDGVMATWVHGGPVSWGQENFVLALDEPVNLAALDENGEFLALAAGSNVHIYSFGTTLTSLFSFETTGDQIFHLEWQPGKQKMGHATLFTSTAGGNLVKFRDGDIQMRSLRPRSLSVNLHHIDISGLEEIIKTSMNGHVAGLGSSAFSQSGRFMLVAGEEMLQNGENWREVGFIDVWDLSGMQLRARARLVGHTGKISWAGYSPDESIIGTASLCGTLKLWSAATGALIHSLDEASRQSWIAQFSHSGEYIANGYGGDEEGVRIWNTGTGECIYSVVSLSGLVRSLAFSPDDGYLAFGSHIGVLKILKLQKRGPERLDVEISQEWRREFGTNPLEQAFVEVLGLVWLDMGKKLAFRTGTDCGVEVYDFASNRKWRFAPQTGAEQIVGVSQPVMWHSSASTVISVDCDGRVRFWTVE